MFLPSDLSIRVYRRASDLPPPFWSTLQSSPRNANVILPSAIKALADEQSGLQQNNVAWIICSSNSTIEFILSITEGYMGSYPAFIFTTLPFHVLTDDYIRPCIVLLAKALAAAVPTRRVYSVFGPEPVAYAFAEEWTRLTGIRSYPEAPYYAAKITYCTADSLDKRNATVDPSLGYDLRPAVPSDIPGIAELCFLFADESFPFQLSKSRAFEEATLLVNKKQVWVHVAQFPGKPKEIASIVAYTRNSETVGTISKVCTNPKWRRRGCAERLVRRVCKHLLTTGRKESVVLYVAHDNRPATHVYHRVGFAGLAEGGPAVDGVDPWVEIGFDRNRVQLGHW